MLLNNNRRLSQLIFPVCLWVTCGWAMANGGEVHEVEMIKFKFVPDEITIKKGDTIRWINKERRQFHTIWFREAGEKDSGEYFPEEVYEKTFDEVGDFPYLCRPHGESHGMTGIVHVVE